MSEINIQRKSGSGVMWWVLGIIALLILVWLMFGNVFTNPQTGQVLDSGSPVAALTTIDGYVV